MMKTITLHSYGKSHVEAFADCYAEMYGKVLLLSIIGNDSVVKAISGTLLDKSGKSGSLYVDDKKRWNGRTCLYRDPRATYRVTSAKLRSGVTHQLIYDERFFQANEKDEGNYDEGTRYVLVNPGEVAADLVYQAVLKHLPTPTLSEWSHAIYKELRARSDEFGSRSTGKIKEIAAYPEEVKVLSVQVSEEALDAAVGEMVKRGIISWD